MIKLGLLSSKMKHRLLICCKCHVRINGELEYLLTEENKLDRSFWAPNKKALFEKVYHYCSQKHFKEDSLWNSMFIPINRS